MTIRHGSGVPTAAHWGTYRAETKAGRLLALHPYQGDPQPSAIGQGMVDSIDGPVRIREPAVRRSFLEARGPAGPERRGADPFVAVDWETALDLAAQELRRVRDAHGNEAIFAGSYGWASAGRFHHAQSQLHRFMNLFGGYVRSVNAYSYAAAEVILPHVIGSLRQVTLEATSWPVIAGHGELVVMFGGWPSKNSQVNAGGVGAHTVGGWMARCARHGVRFVNLSPLRDDADDDLAARWLPLRPNSDVAVMLGIAHTLVDEGLHDRAFLDRYGVGFERFLPYLLGTPDGQPKNADWAAGISGLDADEIRALAREMAAHRTLVSVSWSVQRADHGEQPYWMAVVLSAMLGQIGLPGGGFAAGLAAMNGVGNPAMQLKWASLPQGRNAVAAFIPVARIADMLHSPGQSFDYDGGTYRYPHIRLVYWAGGNPFHHHQDLNRLKQAWRQPETVICNEIWWNATARHADIVLPATTSIERNDLACTTLDGHVTAMRQAVEKVGMARDDYEILSGLAGHLGFAEAFTEGRGEMDWIRHLYEVSRQQHARHGIELPAFDRFWEQGTVALPEQSIERVFLDSFRRDPEAHPLTTPSGRIEIFSETIESFGYEDCPGHPVWREPAEWLGSGLAKRYPLHLISNQPKTRLHSQLDDGATSQASKIRGREPVRLNPGDATAREICDGDVVRVYNGRGACLAGARLDAAVAPGVVQLATGAWYDPQDPSASDALDVHGNPNVLTLDKGTSRLAQGPSAHSCLVEVEKFDGPLPPVRAVGPPEIQRPD